MKLILKFRLGIKTRNGLLISFAITVKKCFDSGRKENEIVCPLESQWCVENPRITKLTAIFTQSIQRVLAKRTDKKSHTPVFNLQSDQYRTLVNCLFQFSTVWHYPKMKKVRRKSKRNAILQACFRDPKALLLTPHTPRSPSYLVNQYLMTWLVIWNSPSKQLKHQLPD